MAYHPASFLISYVCSFFFLFFFCLFWLLFYPSRDLKLEFQGKGRQIENLETHLRN